MVRKKKSKMVVGSNNIVRTAIPKKLDKLICEFKVELEKKHKKPVSKQWAALQLTMEFNKRK
jgi:hypothetical protein